MAVQCSACMLMCVVQQQVLADSDTPASRGHCSMQQQDPQQQLVAASDRSFPITCSGQPEPATRTDRGFLLCWMK
jgi:hypothetical protein